MAHPSTLYRFRIDLTDVDQGVYEPIDFRIAMHPSEALPYLLTRVLAFALNAKSAPEFSPGGLSDPDEPCIRGLDQNGSVSLWIEIGNPNYRKLHKAAKAAREVKVYTYKNPELILQELESGNVHRKDAIQVFSFQTQFLDRLGEKLVRDNHWSLMHTDGSITIGIGDESEAGEVVRHQ